MTRNETPTVSFSPGFSRGLLLQYSFRSNADHVVHALDEVVYDKIEQVNSSLQNLVENKLAHEVDDKIVSFRDIVKQQLADEVKDSVGETVKKRVKTI